MQFDKIFKKTMALIAELYYAIKAILLILSAQFQALDLLVSVIAVIIFIIYS
ncbi:hypothetical protein Belba_1252 [Belliella baltica DSM 15883]|uniref:Uncharacterized protein n=1 Tax=Belliella baltica (strain DSM 15883 / CIP 108006 / LMG 21964 / BA134) TaxID=866536 RepID=I3Z3R6_BELBD|nr:hypothetical protein Belba_1252 [Belliella baltica DSM 15883]